MTTPAHQPVPDIVAFLHQQLDDDERVARAAERYWHGVRIESATTAEEDHALRHDPARVLADLESKRCILDELAPHVGNRPRYGHLLRLLALPYAGHPGYRDDWRPA